MNLLVGISTTEIKKIFPNFATKKEYLSRLFSLTNSSPSQKITNKIIDDIIIDTWNYENSKNVIRELYFKSDKCEFSKNNELKIDELLNEWNALSLGKIEWPFAAMNFDQKVAEINRLNVSSNEKDDLVSTSVIRFRRIKEINTLRNDYIENLIIQYNENVIPTLKHSSGVDFYINGDSYDQKVSKSIGKSFVEKHPLNSKQYAIENPKEVAISLYENQDEQRFDANPRLYIVYLDDEITADQIKEVIRDTDFKIPVNVNFTYKFKDKDSISSYNTNCFIILLHK